ncbi:MAG: Glucose-6-phosphate dehydrogenase, C-terminal domain [Verrucomicrobiota bacterium]|nr:Glucose-6-phosphate dehydrogenase, C-terminal domain [Verrucomicrobiota bacterium]
MDSLAVTSDPRSGTSKKMCGFRNPALWSSLEPREMLSLIAMESPGSFEAELVRAEKLKVWRSVREIQAFRNTLPIPKGRLAPIS